MQTVPGERLLSVAEAAERLGVSASTVWRWIDSRRLPAIRIGVRKIRIRSADIEVMIGPARPANETASGGSRAEPNGRLSAEELARRRKLYDEIVEARRSIPKEWLTATEALAIVDAMQLEHDERAAGIRR